VERLYGAARFLLIYFLSGLGGSLASFVLGAGGISAGASGAIFGLIGTRSRISTCIAKPSASAAKRSCAAC
jgi:membrane associated rhomboid family serine protease